MEQLLQQQKRQQCDDGIEQIFGNKHPLPTEESADPRTHMIQDITAFKRQSALLGRPAPHPRCHELYEFAATETAL